MKLRRGGSKCGDGKGCSLEALGASLGERKAVSMSELERERPVEGVIELDEMPFSRPVTPVPWASRRVGQSARSGVFKGLDNAVDTYGNWGSAIVNSMKNSERERLTVRGERLGSLEVSGLIAGKLAKVKPGGPPALTCGRPEPV